MNNNNNNNNNDPMNPSDKRVFRQTKNYPMEKK